MRKCRCIASVGKTVYAVHVVIVWELVLDMRLVDSRERREERGEMGERER